MIFVSYWHFSKFLWENEWGKQSLEWGKYCQNDTTYFFYENNDLSLIKPTWLELLPKIIVTNPGLLDETGEWLILPTIFILRCSAVTNLHWSVTFWASLTPAAIWQACLGVWRLVHWGVQEDPLRTPLMPPGSTGPTQGWDSWAVAGGTTQAPGQGYSAPTWTVYEDSRRWRNLSQNTQHVIFVSMFCVGWKLQNMI